MPDAPLLWFGLFDGFQEIADVAAGLPDPAGAWVGAPEPEVTRADYDAMIARVRVVTPAQYLEWLTAQKNAINAANAQVTQLRQTLTANGNL